MAGKKDRIERINSQAVPLPEAFVDWMDRRMPRYIIYEAGKTDGKCTGCGAVSNYKKLRINERYTCPACHRKAIAKTKKTIVKRDSRKFIYMQKINNGVMVRFIERIYHFSGEGIAAKECEENLRGAVEKGRRQYWYENVPRWTHHGYTYGWQENPSCWSSKSANNPLYHWKSRKPFYNVPEVYQRNLRGIINDSNLRWFSDEGKELIGKIYARKCYRLYASAFMDVYEALHRWPCLEALYKVEMKEFVEDYIARMRNYNMKLNKKETKPHKILGIPKELYRALPQNTNQTYVEKAKTLYEYTKNITLIRLVIERLSVEEIRLFFKANHMKAEKTLRYINKVENVYIYRDYLHMAREFGSDMTDEFVLYPRDLDAAHDAMIEVKVEARRKKELKEAKEKDEDLRKIYKKIAKRFSYEDDTFVLRPAKTKTEIVKEGQTQHICVGTAGYAEKMIRGSSYILFLRKKDHPEKPFYTVEITPQYEIIQRHGKYNKEGKEVTAVDAFLEKFRREVGHVEVNHAVGV